MDTDEDVLQLPASLASATWQEIAAYVRKESKAFADAEREVRLQAEQARNRAESARDKANDAQRAAMQKLVEEQEARWKSEEEKDAAKAEVARLEQLLAQIQVSHGSESKVRKELEQQLHDMTKSRDVAEANRIAEKTQREETARELQKEQSIRQQAEAVLEQLRAVQRQLETEYARARETIDALQHELSNTQQREDHTGMQYDELQQLHQQVLSQLSSQSHALEETTRDLEMARAACERAEAAERDAAARAAAIQEQCQTDINMERGLRHKAELEVQEALKEMARIEKMRQAAEVAQNDLASSHDNERRLRKQAEDERDQTLEWLREEQRRRRDAESTLEDYADRLQASDATSGRLQSLQATIAGLERELTERTAALEHLQATASDETRRRRAAEAAWQDTERSRREAIQERKAAEKAWQEISEMLAHTEQSRQEAVAAVLGERAARIMAQQSLESVTSGMPLSKEYSEQVRLALLHELRTEQRALEFMYQALNDVKESQKAVLQELSLQQSALKGSLQDLAVMKDEKNTMEEQLESEREARLHVQSAFEQLESVRQKAFVAAEQAMAEVQAARDAAMVARQELDAARAALDAELDGGDSERAEAAEATRELVSRHLQQSVFQDSELQKLRESMRESRSRFLTQSTAINRSYQSESAPPTPSSGHRTPLWSALAGRRSGDGRRASGDDDTRSDIGSERSERSVQRIVKPTITVSSGSPLEPESSATSMHSAMLPLPPGSSPSNGAVDDTLHDSSRSTTASSEFSVKGSRSQPAQKSAVAS